MFKRMCLVGAALFVCAAGVLAQTTTGLMTGTVTDNTGAAIVGADVAVTNQDTGIVRATKSGKDGIYLLSLLPPGNYRLTVKEAGFATENRADVRLDVNQSATVDFKLVVSATDETITVTGATPLLNTTSATLSAVINHETTVGLPLNGREFTQLALLSPGATPVQNGQQTTYTVALGAGGISPSVNGQQGFQNNYTMDGVLNNSTRTDVWAISPPPDAIEEFDVQSHITDAQFAISSGANINLVTRSGTNAFHGALWEFLRNDALDARTFPATTQLPYRQNQYGLYVGGPVILPKVHGKDNTWFSLYWEGFRSSKSSPVLADVLTPDMLMGNFAGIEGKTVIGTDSLGRPEYANEIYDPLTSRPDPMHPGEFLRDPFQGNMIPMGRINAGSKLILQKFYPGKNLNVPEGTLPNYSFNGVTKILSDIFGARLDRKITENDTAFLRFNRSNIHRLTPEALPTYDAVLSNYAQQAVFGYTHLFNARTILNFRYGYTYTNVHSLPQPAGEAFVDALNYGNALSPRDGIAIGPDISIANGFSSVTQDTAIVGPQEGMDYHLDLVKTAGRHTLGFGVMYYHLRALGDGWSGAAGFTQNATAQDGTAGPTGYGPASFLLGTLDTYKAIIGNTGSDQTVPWYGVYAQDQWQATPKLVITAGLRWDYVAPPNFHKPISALDILTGQFIITQPVAPVFPKATDAPGFFEPQYNGYEPRFGITYSATQNLVAHAAFAMLDDHNNSLLQENQNLRTSWPTSLDVNLTTLDIGVPTTYVDSLPAASSFLTATTPYASYGANPNNKIPYSMQFNAGIQQQLSNSMVFKLDYVGSLNRHQYFAPVANVAQYPGPGTVLSREPYPQYGGPFSFAWNEMPSSYNALQAQMHKALSNGLLFQASYTWSKSLDWVSDPYTSVEYFYNLKGDWGPSSFNFKHLLTLSGVYQLPVGRGKAFLGNTNSVVNEVVGGWMLGTIISMRSGMAFHAGTGADVANVGTTSQRPNRVGLSPYMANQSPTHWLNPAAFAKPAAYTFGNEGRDDLNGPAFRNVDFNASKDFHLINSASLQFRAEFFNLFNTTNYGTPNATLTSTAFGTINTSAGSGREIQFALKLLF